MAAYDPKRPRPSASTPADDPAPVEALRDPAPADPAPADPTPAPVEPARDEPAPAEAASPEAASPEAASPEAGPLETEPEDEAAPAAETSAEPAVTSGIALNGSSGAASRTPSDVPVAPAPQTGTANRAVVIAAAVSAIVALLVVVLLARRRRQD